MSMKNIRVLSFSFYPLYASNQNKHECDLVTRNRGTFVDMSLGRK